MENMGSSTRPCDLSLFVCVIAVISVLLLLLLLLCK